MGRRFTKREVIEQFAFETNSENANAAHCYIIQQLNLKTDELNEDKDSKLKASLKALASSVDKRWRKASRTKQRFETQNKNWLDSEFLVY